MPQAEYLKLPNGKKPFLDWFSTLDIITQARIQTYIDRMIEGVGKNNIKTLGEGFFELKMYFGPGFRIYFVQEKEIYWLIHGGDKSTQFRDIAKTKLYWSKYVSK